MQLFTSAQPIAMGIFERQCSQDIRMKFPVLYRQNKDAFNLKTFFMWVGNSIVHSIFLFWLSYWAMGDGIVWGHGAEGGYLVLGNFIYTVSDFCQFFSNSSENMFIMYRFFFCFAVRCDSCELKSRT